MAIRESQPARLRITVQVGEEVDGTPILRNRVYNRVHSNITDADILAIGEALGSLQKHPTVYVCRIDEARLYAE